MKTRRLGATGPEVSAIGFGAMSLAGAFGETTEEASFAALDAMREVGITFVDTANIYGPHISEEVLGRWMAARSWQPVIATKAGIQRDPDRPVNNDPAYLAAELDGSLTRLGVDRVELFYIHRREQDVPVEDVAGLMGQLIAAGKIGGWGMSEVSPTTLRRAHAETPVMAVQNEYSLWTRQPELGLVQACAELGVAFVPFSPLARGTLGSVAFDAAQPVADDFRAQMPRFQQPNWAQNLCKINAFRSLAATHRVEPAALALAWLLARGDHLIPIPGTRSAAHVREWVGAPDLVERADLLAEVDALMPSGWAWGDRYSDAQARAPERYC